MFELADELFSQFVIVFFESCLYFLQVEIVGSRIVAYFQPIRFDDAYLKLELSEVALVDAHCQVSKNVID